VIDADRNWHTSGTAKLSTSKQNSKFTGPYSYNIVNILNCDTVCSISKTQTSTAEACTSYVACF